MKGRALQLVGYRRRRESKQVREMASDYNVLERLKRNLPSVVDCVPLFLTFLPGKRAGPTQGGWRKLAREMILR